MKKFSTYTKLHRLIAIAAVMVIMIAVILQGSFSAPLSSYAESLYTDVLTDLQKDESFDISDYPANSSDYSLYVKQIAESEDGELFIYVYQPYTGSTYDLTATSINISMTIGEDNLSYKNYSLSLISESGTLYKYIVDNFTVKSATVRYYDISAIYRTYYTAIDGEETGGNTTSELAIAVTQCWAVGELNGETYYDMEQTTVVTINAYAGFIRYSSSVYLSAFGLSTNYEYIDSHFVAFSCDYDIEELYDADISFYTQSKYVNTLSYNDYDGESQYATVTYGDIDSTYYDTPLTIDCGDEVSYEASGWLGILGKTTYSWDRICTVNDFLENLEENETISYDSDFVDNVSAYQWVVRFYETEFKSSTTGSALTATNYQFYSTLVTDVTILRLKFLSDGEVYNLGVVSNKITESSEPDAIVSLDPSISVNLGSNWKIILAVILLILLLVLFAPILPVIIQGVVGVIALPFKLVGSIGKSSKKSSDKDKKE